MCDILYRYTSNKMFWIETPLELFRYSLIQSLIEGCNQSLYFCLILFLFTVIPEISNYNL